MRLVVYWYRDTEKIRRGVEWAKGILSTLGNGYYETHLRSVLEAYIQSYENLAKEELSLEDIMLENAYPSRIVEALEEGMEAFFEKGEENTEAALYIERNFLKEVDARHTEVFHIHKKCSEGVLGKN